VNETGPRVAGLDAEFERRFFADGDALVAARWWHVDMRSVFPDGRPTVDEDRRAVIAAVVGSAIAIVFLTSRGCSDDDDTTMVTKDAIDLQREQGWNVGAAEGRLVYLGATNADIVGATDWSGHVQELQGILTPKRPALQPYAVGTLFQVLTSPSFRTSLYPVRTDDTDRAFARGQALAALFRSPLATPDTALIIDLPGPEAVAVAAGLADTFEPVLLFDNWPHPRAVVPSHEVLGAEVYYRPVFAAEYATRSVEAAPAFILDANRLLPYVDAADRFDNRYLARLPSASGLAALSVRHVLYVTSNVVPHELDDLNDDFVALTNAGIDVKMVALSQFLAPDSAQPLQFTYGGMHEHHVWFWHSYGSVSRPLPRTEIPPARLSEGASFRPAPRVTMFSSRVVGGGPGIGKVRPSGFGRVSMQTSRVSGGRSGSFGRARFFAGG
jgi:hypothetical protein